MGESKVVPSSRSRTFLGVCAAVAFLLLMLWAVVRTPSSNPGYQATAPPVSRQLTASVAVVPSVVGRTADEARQILASNGLQMKLTYARSPRTARITSQLPQAGVRVQAASYVFVVTTPPGSDVGGEQASR